MIDKNYTYLKRFFLPFQDKVGRWGDRTFPHSTPTSIINHIKLEVKELEDACKHGTYKEYCTEMADVFLLLLHLAYKANANLILYVIKKFAVCKLRKWGKPDSRGVCEHLKN